MSTESELPSSSDEPPERSRSGGARPSAARPSAARPSAARPSACCEVALQNPRRYPEAGARRHRSWLERLVAELAPAAESFAVRFVSDREMRRLNATYRRQDRTTDVLSFPDGEDGDLPRGDGHLGDVAISVPAARRQAAQRRHGVERELRVLMLHGLLHCLGHDHETDGGTMERLERRLRQRWIEDE